MLFSDGIHNAAGDPVAAARKLGVVVHAIGVGNSLRNSPSYRDVRVAGLECPEQLPVNNRARITAQVGQSGLAGQVVKAVLEQDGKPLDQAEVVLRDGEARPGGRLRVRAHGQGPAHLHGAHSARARGEDRPEQPPVGRGPGGRQQDPGALHRGDLARRVRRRWCSGSSPRTPTSSSAPWSRPAPTSSSSAPTWRGSSSTGLPADAATLEKFDVILLGDLDSQLLEAPGDGAPDQAGARRGGPAGVRRLSQPGAGGYGGTPLEAILPVVTGDRDIGQITDPFLPILTPAGRDHPIFANIGKFFPTPDCARRTSPGLPPLDGCVRVKGARPGALVLATHPAGDAKMPVLAVAAGRQGARGRLHQRHDAELAAGSQGPGPGVAVHAVLGADDPLAGQPHRGGEGRGRASPPTPTRPITSRTRPSPSRRRSATRRARGPTRPRWSRRSRARRARPTR